MIQLLNANALRIPLADKSVHCVVTSPPYWGLRDYKVEGQLGLERTPEEYVANVVQVFREVWRVLRNDGIVWLVIGDSYASVHTGGHKSAKSTVGANQNGVQEIKQSKDNPKSYGLKEKDLVGIPWRVAFALQADGWYLRSDIIWHKPNPMPESVTDRPTKAHEYVFLLTKSARYFYDHEAIKEPAVQSDIVQSPGSRSNGDNPDRNDNDFADRNRGRVFSTRNKRSVWTISTKPYKGSHYATYPPALVEPCIKAGTSEKGVCPICGAPWERVMEKKRIRRNELPRSDSRYRPNSYSGAYENINGKGDAGYSEVKTIGWRPTCEHNAEPIPATVLDPFIGSGTTLMVARKLGRSGIGLDLSMKYLTQNARKRLELDKLDDWQNGIAAELNVENLPLFEGARC